MSSVSFRVSILHPSAFNRVLLVLVVLFLHVVILDAVCFCGISQTSKIVGGVNAQLNEFPWQVSFYHILHFIGCRCSKFLLYRNTY
jgi:hypothetical protein